MLLCSAAVISIIMLFTYCCFWFTC